MRWLKPANRANQSKLPSVTCVVTQATSNPRIRGQMRNMLIRSSTLSLCRLGGLLRREGLLGFDLEETRFQHDDLMLSGWLLKTTCKVHGSRLPVVETGHGVHVSEIIRIAPGSHMCDIVNQPRCHRNFWCHKGATV